MPRKSMFSLFSNHNEHHHQHHDDGHHLHRTLDPHGHGHHQHHHGIKSILSRFHHHRRRHHQRHNGGAPHAPPSPTNQSSSVLMMEEKINAAELIFSKWDAEKNAYAKIKLLFSDDREEADQFLRAVTELQNAMVFFVNDELGGASVSRSHPLVRAQNLMQIAMRRLEREFYQILSANHDQLYPESITTISSVSSISTVSEGGDDPDEDIRAAGEFISEVERASAPAVADLRAIAGAMISAGYGKECVQIYKILRKSIVDEGLYRLGFEKLTVNQVQKLSRETHDLRIRTWISAAKVAVKTLFAGERILSDQVFSGSKSISESCFADIARDAAVQFLGFAELVAKSRRSPEKLFRILDLYGTISELWPDIESIFSFGSTSAVRSQAQASLQKLREAARSTLADFEAGIQKDASKSPPPRAGIHPLTRYATNYISLLTDHEATIGEIFADEPIPGKSPSPALPPSINWLLLRLLLVLLSKLDSKAGIYRDEAISHLFLANNTLFIVRKAKEGKLGLLLGEEWEALHIEQARQYARNYEKLAWRKPAEAMKKTSATTAPEKMRAFTAAFEETLRSQREYEIEDESFRQEVSAAIAEMMLPGYRVLYKQCRETLSDSGASVIKFEPADLVSQLSDLFEVLNGSG